jgi:hypothetical protein
MTDRYFLHSVFPGVFEKPDSMEAQVAGHVADAVAADADSPREVALAAIRRVDILAANLYWVIYDLSARPSKRPDLADVGGWVQQAADMHRVSGGLVATLVDLLDEARLQR